MIHHQRDTGREPRPRSRAGPGQGPHVCRGCSVRLDAATCCPTGLSQPGVAARWAKVASRPKKSLVWQWLPIPAASPWDSPVVCTSSEEASALHGEGGCSPRGSPPSKVLAPQLHKTRERVPQAQLAAPRLSHDASPWVALTLGVPTQQRGLGPHRADPAREPGHHAGHRGLQGPAS